MVTSQRRKPVVPQRPAESEEDVHAMLRDCAARSEILREKHFELMAKYPDQWVAIGDNWEFVAAETLREVMAKLKKCGAYPRHSVIKRMSISPPRLRFKPLRRVTQ